MSALICAGCGRVIGNVFAAQSWYRGEVYHPGCKPAAVDRFRQPRPAPVFTVGGLSFARCPLCQSAPLFSAALGLARCGCGAVLSKAPTVQSRPDADTNWLRPASLRVMKGGAVTVEFGGKPLPVREWKPTEMPAPAAPKCPKCGGAAVRGDAIHQPGGLHCSTCVSNHDGWCAINSLMGRKQYEDEERKSVCFCGKCRAAFWPQNPAPAPLRGPAPELAKRVKVGQCVRVIGAPNPTCVGNTYLVREVHDNYLVVDAGGRRLYIEGENTIIEILPDKES